MHLGSSVSRRQVTLGGWTSLHDKMIDAKKMNEEKHHLQMSFAEMLYFLCLVTLGLSGVTMVTVVTCKHHKDFKVPVKRTISSHPSVLSELLQ